MAHRYGKLVLGQDEQGKGVWTLEGQPHIMIAFKRVFGKSNRAAHGTIEVHDNDAVRRDLDWFLYRHELEVSVEDRKAIEKGARRHHDLIVTLEKMIDPNYKPLDVRMALPPREYQKVGAAIALKKGSLLLADDLGLGKTCSAICTMSAGWTLPAVVVTIAGAMPVQWQEEIAKFMPQLHTHVLKKGTPYELPKKDGRGPDVVILNYHKLSGWDNVLKKYCRSVVFDEAHELRHTDSDKYEAAKNLSEGMKFRIGLTGTPVFNFGGEIFNVLNILTPDALGTAEEFYREWCYGSYRTDPVVRDPKALGSYLRENFLMLRRTRKEVGRELPPLQKIPQRIECDAEELDKIKDSAARLARIILSNRPKEEGEVMNAGGQLSVMLRQSTGISKCVAPETKVLKSDGSVVVVKNLRVGDCLLGPDSKPRRILNISHGRGDMYEVSSTSKNPLFAPYRVNGDHVLAMRVTGKVRHNNRNMFPQYSKGDHIEISVHEYLGKSKHFKHLVKGFKVGVEFLEQPLPLDPYFLGLWLGNGTSLAPAITTPFPEIKKYIYEFSRKNKLLVGIKCPGRTAPTYHISTKKKGVGVKGRQGFAPTNPLIAILKKLNVFGNKHIPEIYLNNSRENRIKLLAGLIDTDGCLAHGVYMISSKWKHLADQIRYLASSLGLAAKTRKRIVSNQSRKKFVAYSTSIYGKGCDKFPILTPHRKSKKRRQIKDPLRCGISIRPVGKGPHVGFSLDGDGLFLLHDFTVTHNSPYIADFIRLLVDAGEKVVCFLFHREVYSVVLAKLEDLKPAMFTGSETAAEKVESRRKFMAGETNVLLISLRAGQGLDGLQKVCRTVVIGELDWSPAVMDQCVGRVFRDGQTEPVTAYFLVAEDGADPLIAEKLGLKRAQAEGIRNPDHDILEEYQVDHGRAVELAKRFAEKYKIEIPVEAETK